ncbi:uncharacterized protein B0P05DRAFT_532373 [Gilbertella persicaria]|uniref:uncharacterized protein n=1 Tax=Gilbertella persicaria TaxID=101096 RepID=UPI002220AF13|nr:uncharacterized protein B0P05DRAFT_532373 [Gilbertella persicaria]KAI8087813.1 hypothetical protein B0P05DRAFT_532373 [Gilbertella persicaria]
MDFEANPLRLGRPHSNTIEGTKERRSSLYETPCQIDIKPNSSISTPLSNRQSIDATERLEFLREMQQAREELAEFRKNVADLAKQMDTITQDLAQSGDRVSEIEQNLTATEELNVNLQVLLEKAVKSQKESDVFANQAIKNMCSDLALVVYENNQIQGRLASLENNQQQQKGSVHDMIKRMQEYTHMLEQAQNTIHMLQEPHFVTKSPSVVFPSNESISTSRRTSVASLYDDDNQSATSSSTITTIPKPLGCTYVQSPPLGPHFTSFKPQQGIRMLFDHAYQASLSCNKHE